MAHDLDDRGREARSPGEIPSAGWRDVLTRVGDEARTDQVALLSAGVAFFLLLSIVPALIAALSIYGLVADPGQARQQIEDLTRSLPGAARELLSDQVTSVAERTTAGLSFSALAAVALALWSASSGVRHLVDALNVAYDEDETRVPVRRYGQALVLAAAAIVGGIVALGAIAVLPRLVRDAPLGDVAAAALTWARWPLLAALFGAALGVLYRVGPDRDAPRRRWVTWGAVAATVVWIVASGLFSWYADHLGSFETYGSLAGVVVLMLWLQLTAAAVLLGAELNCELERQTRADSTVGPPRAQGRRGAHAADTVGPPADASTG